MKNNLSKLFTEGSPVDMTDWAYEYRKNSSTNPPEADWLWPHKYLKMEVVNGSMVWNYEDSCQEYTKETLLCGYLWEEPRDVKQVTVEFSNAGGYVPAGEEVWVACRPVDSMWEDCRPWKYDTHLVSLTRGGETVDTQEGKTILTFTCNVERLTKLYIIYTGNNREIICLPTVHAYGAARWEKPLAVEIEWGFQDEKSDLQWDGRLEIYNGAASEIQPLEKGNGLVVLNDHQWKEDKQTTGRRGIQLNLSSAVGPVNCRTVVTLWTKGGDISFAARDLDQGPIYIPSVGIFVTKAGGGTSANQFVQQINANPRKTLRQRVKEHSEQSLEVAIKEYYGNQELPAIPTPPYPPVMEIDVPEKQINEMWKLGAWHLKRWAMKLDDQTYCVSIWPFNKGENDKVGVDGREGAASLGAETYQIIRSMDLLGLHDVAEGGLNYWLFGEHATPFIWCADVIGSDSLTNPFNSPNHRSPGYDQKHSGGNGKVLHTVAFHYHITGNDDWMKKAKPVLEKACQAVIRLRREWMKQVPPDAWCYGLIPPSNTGDGGNNLLLYYMSSLWQAGLKEVASILDKFGSEMSKDWLKEADLFLQDMRRSADRSMVMTPVVRVRDGTFRRFIPWQPYLRGMGTDIVSGLDGYYVGPIECGLRMVPEVYLQDETVIQETLDVDEDVLLSKGIPDPLVGESWFSRGGINSQPGHEVHPMVYLLRDEIPSYIRCVFNAFAAEVDPFKEYVFWEGPAKAGAPDKTFEEAAFLERLRMMLVMEKDNSLWLGRATPRAWLEQGKKITVAKAPTFFGPVAYQIVSDVDHGMIHASIEMPTRKVPKMVYLRLRHPQAAPIKSVLVNGKPYSNFDNDREMICLENLKGTVEVWAVY